jgi:hypothetical protein
MIVYTNIRDNLIWQGVWSEVRSFIQNWRKELGLSLNDRVDIAFRIMTDSSVKAALTIANTGCDTKEVNLEKLSLKELLPENYWRVLASGCQFIGTNALLNSVRVTHEVTGEEAYWESKQIRY